MEWTLCDLDGFVCSIYVALLAALRQYDFNTELVKLIKALEDFILVCIRNIQPYTNFIKL